jgi:hypothetical protein
MIVPPMSRFSRPLLAIALFALAPFARAGTLSVVAPAAGATLRGGSFAELRWTSAQLPPSAEEWEAFLSIDGGKYYAFRVTPHLDIAMRRFTFLVPNVGTHDARILIRTGDEVHESHFEARGSFTIVRDPRAEEVVLRLRGFGRGEAARDGDPAVLSWADGARNGSGITQRGSMPVRSSSLGPLATMPREWSPVIVPSAIRVASPALDDIRHPDRDPLAKTAATIPSTADLLLVCRRRNI